MACPISIVNNMLNWDCPPIARQKGIDTLLPWLTVHSPISSNQELMSLATGGVGFNTTNCNSAVEVGTIAMKNILSQTFGDFHINRNNFISLSSVTNSTKVRWSSLIGIPWSCLSKSDEDFASCLEYEPPFLWYFHEKKTFISHVWCHRVRSCMMS